MERNVAARASLDLDLRRPIRPEVGVKFRCSVQIVHCPPPVWRCAVCTYHALCSFSVCSRLRVSASSSTRVLAAGDTLERFWLDSTATWAFVFVLVELKIH